VEVGLIDATELKRFAADSAEGVLGLSRALVKAGKLTSYQAAAAYQKKSRGLLVGKYLILDKLGQGGMGMVFKARHRTHGRVGALKILPPSFTRDPNAVMRFRREFEAAGRLKHINLVAAFEADEDRGVHYLVMDYVRGITLERVVREHGPLPVSDAVDYLIQAARGLEAAHETGIVHRDIKPGNLMLDRDGTIRVLDLGLARIVGAGNSFDSSAGGRLTQTGIFMGTIDFMAPEQAEDSHNVDHRADVYSLGCTLYFLLTGREPFPGPSILRRMAAHLEHPPPSLRADRPDIPPGLETAYQKMMAKRPEDRPASMSKVIALLHAARPSSDDATGSVALRPEPSLAQAATNQRAPERSGTTTTADSMIFVRRAAEEETLGSHELNLRDLVMEVRPDLPGTAEVGNVRDESKSAFGRLESSLRDLAPELGEQTAQARGPKPPGAAAQPLKRMAAPEEDETASQAPVRCAGAEIRKPQPGPREEAKLPSASKPSAAEAQPPKRLAEPRRHGVLPAASNRAAAERQALTPAAKARQKDVPPNATKPPATERQRPEPAASIRSGDRAPNKAIAVLAVISVILVALAVVVSIGRRPSPAKKTESAKPAPSAVEGESSTDGAQPPPL
jgi:serine/threonine protein kinase